MEKQQKTKQFSTLNPPFQAEKLIKEDEGALFLSVTKRALKQ